MASAISAAKAKFDALAAAGFPSATRPKLYLDDAPLVQTGAQVRPPFAILVDEGEAPENVFDEAVVETTRFKLTLYYADLGDADTAALAVRRNGGTAQQAQGFDFGTLTGLPAGFTSMSLLRTASRRYLAANGQDGGRVYAVELSYTATVQA